MKQKRKKKWLVLVGTFVVIVAAAVVGFQLYMSPTAEFARAVESGDLAAAYKIYQREFKRGDISEKMTQRLVEAATQAQEAYMADEISYDEAVERLDTLSEFGDSAVEEAVSSARESISDKHRLENLLQDAEKSAAARDYLSAMQSYKNALSLDETSEAAAKGLESASAAYQKSVVDEAYAAKDTGDWDTALEILDTYQKTYGQEKKIAEAYKDIEKQRPITLKNITMVSSDEVTVIEEPTKDRWDNLYDGAVEFDTRYDSYGYYSLEKKYTKFTGTIFVSPNASNENDMSVTIYKDNEIAYHLDHITENTPPASFEVDLTGASTMKIVTANESNVWNGLLLFGNTAFEKTA